MDVGGKVGFAGGGENLEIVICRLFGGLRQYVKITGKYKTLLHH